jgi:hypothetical protein
MISFKMLLRIDNVELFAILDNEYGNKIYDNSFCMRSIVYMFLIYPFKINNLVFEHMKPCGCKKL